jgi:hypothetical protein
VDYVIVPVVGMLLYQKVPNWGWYLLACAATSAVMSFACEPFAVYLGMYRLLKWRYIYSFPIYIALAALFKLLCSLIIRRQEKSRK